MYKVHTGFRKLSVEKSEKKIQLIIFILLQIGIIICICLYFASIKMNVFNVFIVATRNFQITYMVHIFLLGSAALNSHVF